MLIFTIWRLLALPGVSMAVLAPITTSSWRVGHLAIAVAERQLSMASRQPQYSAAKGGTVTGPVKMGDDY